MQHSQYIKGVSDDLNKRDIPIISSVTAVDLLEVNESLYLPDNTYTILSSLQLWEHGIQVYNSS